jgi:hypothetical protein
MTLFWVIKQNIMNKVVTYSLLNGQDFSDEFYSDILHFTDKILSEARPELEWYIANYMEYISENKIETLRTREEYILELIIVGVLWSNYMPHARKTKFISKVLLQRLYEIRQLNPSIKDSVDNVRGVLAYELLTNTDNNISIDFSLKAFKSLLEWLEATGEFREETIRLNSWYVYLKSYTTDDVSLLLQVAVNFAQRFSLLGMNELGKYLPNVEHFRTVRLKEYKYKEDYFFVARHSNEYILNMFGAEIMNRAMSEDFMDKPEKAVLLPTCMRNEPYDGCKAESDGKEQVCKSCFAKCNIGKAAAHLRKHNIKTYLIPHSSDFSKFLKKWESNNEIGLVGVACVLNLLTGGYEMKRLGITSQCVFLDYCGCKKHWDEEGIITDLNIHRLMRFVESNVGVFQS